MPAKPVGLTRDLPAGRVMHAEVDGTDIVVWRATNGEIAAWNNRCPHRGMALSHGFVRGNALACLYHGWHYDRSGRCSYIPAHPDLDPPATIHAAQYGVAEDGGVIWVDVAGEARGEETGLEPLRTFIVDAPADRVRAAAASVGGATAQGEGVRLGGDALRLLCNPLSDGSTQVTILTGPDLPAARRRDLSRWCEAVRRDAEGMR